MADLDVARGLHLQLGVALKVQEVPGCGLKLAEAHHGSVRGADHLSVAPQGQSRHIVQGRARIQGLHHIHEGQFPLADADRIRDAVLEVHLGDDAGEPSTPDDGQAGVLLAHHLGGHVTVVDLIAEDARAGETKRPLASLIDLLHVVGIDHGVDQDDLVALLGRAGGDVQQLKRQKVGTEHLPPRGVGAVRKEQNDFAFALDHDQAGAWGVTPEVLSMLGLASRSSLR